MIHPAKSEAELQNALMEELASIRTELERLSSGQAALACTMEKINANFSYLLTDARPSEVAPVVHNAADELLAHDATDGAEDRVFGSLQNREEERKEHGLPLLMKLVEINDEVKKREQEADERYKKASWMERLHMLEMATRETILDSVISIVILSNAIFIGVSSDNWNGVINMYFLIDAVFSILFLAELVLKISMFGFRGYFFGKDSFSDIFDATLVSLDLLQLILVLFAKEATESMQEAGVPSASLFRAVRLMRVMRVLRLLRHPSFQDLLQMLDGIRCGVTTLGWATVVFIFVVYVGALLCRDVFGENIEHVEVYRYFNNVPRAMYTVFRCSFGDCSTDGGQPLPEFLNKNYGGVFSVLYSLYMFCLTIGLFNVFSAIFVDSTMARAAEGNLKKMQERFANEQLFATRVCTVVSRCLEKGGFESEFQASGCHITRSMLVADIPSEVVHDLCQKDEKTINALNELDIDRHDHGKLAEILDPDHSGTIQFVDILHGLQALRGQPRRSDVVTINLMLRAAQERLDDIYEAVVGSAEHLKSTMRTSFSEPTSPDKPCGRRTWI